MVVVVTGTVVVVDRSVGLEVVVVSGGLVVVVVVVTGTVVVVDRSVGLEVVVVSGGLVVVVVVVTGRVVVVVDVVVVVGVASNLASTVTLSMIQ
ncbi:MAG: hypothetical protein DRJ28_00715 [Actinobacteria bacterium]|nr:MAG: hypothetical protein DRJ28_00715 [Actinomycetota bacterium]